MKINDLIFKELIKRGYSLEGKTRVWNIADSKLWYLTPNQAQKYLDLDKDASYKKYTGQKQGELLEEKNINEIIEGIGRKVAINIVDLGCGDGTKAAKIMTLLKDRYQMRYCPIDISGYMVQKAIETISKLKIGDVIQAQYNISDFENLENVTPLLKKGKFRKNVFLFLGNTLGNFEIHDILYSIKSAMGEGDILIVDTAVDDKKQEERAREYSKNKKLQDWLVHIPLQLGLKKEDVTFDVRFRNQRIEAYYIVNKDVTIKFQNKTLVFAKGDQIIVAIAYKHDKEDLKTYFNMHFGYVKMILSDDKSKALIICKK